MRVSLATEDGHDIEGLIVMGASAYLDLDRGYDADTDTLVIGRTTCNPSLITENGDIVAYWQVDEDDPDGFRDAIGVAHQAGVGSLGGGDCRAERHIGTL